MPRTIRACFGGHVYHVLNRGNGQADVFHSLEDFASFVGLMQEANQKVSMRLVGYCLMMNHFHLMLWPHEDGDISRWMQWLMTTHVRKYHLKYQTSGHVWQGRYKSFMVNEEEHYLTVLRYIERNPIRAGLVTRCEDWEWSSFQPTVRSGPAGLLSDGPVAKPPHWYQIVNGVESNEELKRIRDSIS
jgi:putative transposase